AAGMLFRIAPPDVQRRFAPAGRVLGAASRLLSAGRLTPDSDPRKYAESIKQYAVWARLGGWDARTFTETWIDKTRKTAAATGVPWTKPMEDELRRVAPARWRDIQRVLAE